MTTGFTNSPGMAPATATADPSMQSFMDSLSRDLDEAGESALKQLEGAGDGGHLVRPTRARAQKNVHSSQSAIDLPSFELSTSSENTASISVLQMPPGFLSQTENDLRRELDEISGPSFLGEVEDFDKDAPRIADQHTAERRASPQIHGDSKHELSLADDSMLPHVSADNRESANHGDEPADQSIDRGQAMGNLDPSGIGTGGDFSLSFDANPDVPQVPSLSTIRDTTGVRRAGGLETTVTAEAYDYEETGPSTSDVGRLANTGADGAYEPTEVFADTGSSVPAADAPVADATIPVEPLDDSLFDRLEKFIAREEEQLKRLDIELQAESEGASFQLFTGVQPDNGLVHTGGAQEEATFTQLIPNSQPRQWFSESKIADEGFLYNTPTTYTNNTADSNNGGSSNNNKSDRSPGNKPNLTMRPSSARSSPAISYTGPFKSIMDESEAEDEESLPLDPASPYPERRSPSPTPHSPLRPTTGDERHQLADSPYADLRSPSPTSHSPFHPPTTDDERHRPETEDETDDSSPTLSFKYASDLVIKGHRMPTPTTAESELDFGSEDEDEDSSGAEGEYGNVLDAAESFQGVRSPLPEPRESEQVFKGDAFEEAFFREQSGGERDFDAERSEEVYRRDEKPIEDDQSFRDDIWLGAARSMPERSQSQTRSQSLSPQRAPPRSSPSTRDQDIYIPTHDLEHDNQAPRQHPPPRLPSPFAAMTDNDDTPPSALSVDLQPPTPAPRSFTRAPPRSPPTQPPEQQQQHPLPPYLKFSFNAGPEFSDTFTTMQDATDTMHTVASAAVHPTLLTHQPQRANLTPVTAKPVVDALRVLQSKVGKLESEKAVAKERIRDLEGELGRARGAVLMEQATRLRESQLRESQLRGEVGVRGGRWARERERERESERRDAETQVSGEEDVGAGPAVSPRRTATRDPPTVSPPQPTHSHQHQQPTDEDLALRRERDLALQKLHDSLTEVALLRREVALRDREIERTKREADVIVRSLSSAVGVAAASAGGTGRVAHPPPAAHSAPSTHQDQADMSWASTSGGRLSYANVPEVAGGSKERRAEVAREGSPAPARKKGGPTSSPTRTTGEGATKRAESRSSGRSDDEGKDKGKAAASPGKVSSPAPSAPRKEGNTKSSPVQSQAPPPRTSTPPAAPSSPLRDTAQQPKSSRKSPPRNEVKSPARAEKDPVAPKDDKEDAEEDGENPATTTSFLLRDEIRALREEIERGRRRDREANGGEGERSGRADETAGRKSERELLKRSAGGVSDAAKPPPPPASTLHPNMITKDRLRRLIVNKLLEKERNRVKTDEDETGTKVMWKRVDAGGAVGADRVGQHRRARKDMQSEHRSADERTTTATRPRSADRQRRIHEAGRAAAEVRARSVGGAGKRASPTAPQGDDRAAKLHRETRGKPARTAATDTTTTSRRHQLQQHTQAILHQQKEKQQQRSVKTQTGEARTEPRTERGGGVAATSSASRRRDRADPAGGPAGTRLFMEMPFVVGKSATKSYSVTANLQQVLSLLKAHNPSLCSVCSSRRTHGLVHSHPPHTRRPPRDPKHDGPLERHQHAALAHSGFFGARLGDGLARGPASTRSRRTGGEKTKRTTDEDGDGDEFDDHASFHGDVLDTAAAVALAAATVGAARTRSLTRKGGDRERERERGERRGGKAAEQGQGQDSRRGTRGDVDRGRRTHERDDGMTTLERVLAVLEDEFQDLKRHYHTLVRHYESVASRTTSSPTDPIDAYTLHHASTSSHTTATTTTTALRSLGDDLRHVIRAMDTKGDQIAILREILRGFGRVVGNAGGKGTGNGKGKVDHERAAGRV
ncbi:uncharacterized protein EV422DRAFT_599033 [Fimicolochytrium jonesii]|uniref:uncharacterized protein n=1 Tax=Fimicolochytrium jonesii TaxID=1396493 RepID=UPI0022FDB191|nr:uncharacterized protein EV422DRAFT_599033 [Fimicolochytrium jonesii]KAI8819100.1 hypothetical protein EV422DRAFT_599033 [Fimicolochytrium jonesii]